MGVKFDLSKKLLIILMVVMAIGNEDNLVTANGTWAGSKYQIECTMCAACDNPCATPSPPPPQPPSPLPPSPSNICPPPPSPPSSGGNYYYSPPPPPPSSSGGGGSSGGNYYSSPPPPYQNYPSGPTPPPPNPIVPYFPFYFYNPPPPSQSTAFKLTHFSSKSSFVVTVFIVLFIFL
ncbi:unnamed protein product [Withania somnifera]